MASETAQSYYYTYRDYNYLSIYLVSEDETYNDPTQEALNSYAMEHGIGYPLLADTSWMVQSRFSRDSYMPSFILFSPGPTVEIVDDPELSEDDIRAALGLD